MTIKLAENCGSFTKQIRVLGVDARFPVDLNWIEGVRCVKSLRPPPVYLLLVRGACVADSYLIRIQKGSREYFIPGQHRNFCAALYRMRLVRKLNSKLSIARMKGNLFGIIIIRASCRGWACVSTLIIYINFDRLNAVLFTRGFVLAKLKNIFIVQMIVNGYSMALKTLF